MSKINEAVGDKNRLDKLGGKIWLVCHFQIRGSVNVLCEFYISLVTYGTKGHMIWGGG